MKLVVLKEKIAALLAEIRNENRWNDILWNEIVEGFRCNVNIWNVTGNVPKSILPYITDLVAMLAGGSRFIDESTAVKLEDAEIQLSELLYSLYDKEDNEADI